MTIEDAFLLIQVHIQHAGSFSLVYFYWLLPSLLIPLLVVAFFYGKV